MSVSPQEAKLTDAIGNITQYSPDIVNDIVNAYTDYACNNLTSVKRAFDGYGAYLKNTIDEFYKLKEYDAQEKSYEETQKKYHHRVETDLNNIMYDKNTASRKHEMNEWTFGNKQDTLFVYSACFIMMSLFILFTGLMRLGTISTSVWSITISFGIIAFILIVANRYTYTKSLRDNRYWNKKRHGSYATRPSSQCLSDTIEDSLSTMSAQATAFASKSANDIASIANAKITISQQQQ
jgi:hypothetical protein